MSCGMSWPEAFTTVGTLALVAILVIVMIVLAVR